MNVALIIFNRPQHTAQVLAQIAKAKPKNLFVIADGPRTERVGEAELVRETRAIIARVDWPCRVYKNYSDINLGCGVRPFTGISWVFNQVDKCIILEDDCVPDPSFFRYCQELLEHYEEDQRIFMISGDNYLQGGKSGRGSYYASVYPFIWGWATWRRSWQRVDFELREWMALRGTPWLSDYLQDYEAARYWSGRFDYVAGGQRRDIWDVAWVFACWRAGGMVLLPRVNLVRNIGWGAESTHTNEAVGAMIVESQPIELPLMHPDDLRVDRRTDRLLFERIFAPRLGLWDRLLWRHTYGIIIRKIPLLGKMWAGWRDRMNERSAP